MSYKKTGIVIADPDEYTPLFDLVRDKTEYDTPFKNAFTFSIGEVKFVAVCCGIGKVNAAACTMSLIDRGCDSILNFGLSGGLKGVRRGQFILPERFLEHDFDLTPLGYKPCEKPAQDYVYAADKDLLYLFSKAAGIEITSTAVCGDRFISDTESRKFLIDTFSASSCDMETAAIASVCHITKTPFVSLRRISDDAGDNAGDSYGQMNQNEGKTLAEVFLGCIDYISREV